MIHCSNDIGLLRSWQWASSAAPRAEPHDRQPRGRRNPGDRRHHALHLTAEGESRLVEIGKAALRNADAYLAPLDVKDQDVLGQLLDRLAAAHGLAPGVHPGFRALGR